MAALRSQSCFSPTSNPAATAPSFRSYLTSVRPAQLRSRTIVKGFVMQNIRDGQRRGAQSQPRVAAGVGISRRRCSHVKHMARQTLGKMGIVMQVVKLRYQERGLRPRRTKLENSGLGRRAPTAGGRFDRTSLALSSVYGGRSIRDRILLSLRRRTTSDHARGETPSRRRFWARPRDRSVVAAIPEFRRSILHVSAAARRQSRRGLGYPHGTASPVLRRPNRHRADCGAGAGAKLVADAVLHGLQIPIGRPNSHLSSWRADGTDHLGSRREQFRSRRYDGRRSGRPRTTISTHLPGQVDLGRGHALEVVDEYRFRWHISSHVACG